jgi:anti-anti-sigma regulatory factor
VKDRDFSTQTQQDGSSVTVHMRGNWDMKAVGPLDEFTRSLQAQVKQVKAERVIVDMGEVEFINSSCLKSFARWLGALSKTGQEPYSVTFRTSVSWQRRSLEALKALGGDKVTIEP